MTNKLNVIKPSQITPKHYSLRKRQSLQRKRITNHDELFEITSNLNSNVQNQPSESVKSTENDSEQNNGNMSLSTNNVSQRNSSEIMESAENVPERNIENVSSPTAHSSHDILTDNVTQQNDENSPLSRSSSFEQQVINLLKEWLTRLSELEKHTAKIDIRVKNVESALRVNYRANFEPSILDGVDVMGFWKMIFLLEPYYILVNWIIT